jgi:hypothetical protein
MATTYELIASTTLGSNASTVTLGSGGTIPQTYTDLLITCSVRTSHTSTIDAMMLRFNGVDSGYSNRRLYGTGSSVVSDNNVAAATYMLLGDAVGTNATANTFSSGEFYIPNYAGATNKSLSSTTVAEHNGTAGYQTALAGLWSNTSAITSIVFYPFFAANFLTGSSFYLYGIKKA